MELGENIKKLLLAGIGTAAMTAEKSKELLDELVRKGELTVEQGKALNQELKHSVKECVENAKTCDTTDEKADVAEILNGLTPQQLAELKEQLAAMDAEASDEEAETK